MTGDPNTIKDLKDLSRFLSLYFHIVLFRRGILIIKDDHMAVKKIDHIGIVVSNLEEAIGRYKNVLGLQLDRIEDYGDGLLNIAFLPLGDLQIELIQPLKPGSTAWDFLNDNGEGIEHVAFKVDSLEAEWGRILEQNIPVADSNPRKGAGNTRICFLQRDALCGVLGEFVAKDHAINNS
jgi:methylmalonyl-CoA/ethylmalonyl-CoA epimerase